MARNPELERTILADPDNEEAYQVYADWLQSEGDPRGELAAVIGKSPVLKQLRVLDLSQGTLSDDGARALLASAPAFAHLERLDLTENFLGDEMIAAVAKLCPDVRAEGQREAYEHRDELHRYVAVGE